MLTFAVSVVIAVLVSILVRLIRATPVVVAVVIAILSQSRAAESERCDKCQSDSRNYSSAKSLHDVLQRSGTSGNTPPIILSRWQELGQCCIRTQVLLGFLAGLRGLVRDRLEGIIRHASPADGC